MWVGGSAHARVTRRVQTAAAAALGTAIVGGESVSEAAFVGAAKGVSDAVEAHFGPLIIAE